MEPDPRVEYALLGGGCFWCLEAAYESIPGVLGVVNGYAGGTLESPTYEQVCSGETGHAEVVRVAYDGERVRYAKLLELFWKIHDPTSLNRQGADVGSQYRSVVFYADEAQREAAASSMAALQAGLRSRVVTELLPAPRFWPAEDYHQGYFRKHPGEGYCRVVIAPKLEKLGLLAL
jgi:peptide-methionine (S)-S-oxide reductase